VSDWFLENMRLWFENNPHVDEDLKKDAELFQKPIFGRHHIRFGIKHTEETKQIIREKRAKQIIQHNALTKEKISKSNKNKIKSPEHRRKLSIAQSNKKGTYSKDRLIKMSEVCLGGKNPKAKKIIAEWKDGTKKSYDCIKSFALENDVNYESAKILLRHGQYSKTKNVKLVRQ